MLSPALRRAHGQLQSHRIWLTAFTSHTAPYNRHSYESRRSADILRLPAGPGWQSNIRCLSVTANAWSKRSNAIWRSQNRRKAPVAAPTVDPTELELANDFRQAITDVNIKDVATLFPEAQKLGIMDRTMTWRISQCLHEALRRHRRLATDKRPREDAEDMVSFAEQLVKAIVKGDLEPDRRGFVHLLAFFKESRAQDQGVKFWTWLEEQDDQHVDVDVYGAALELLAVCGTPLPELEEVYERALQRFPASFNAYHLSPDAVVPDRDQATQIKGLSMMLLQGIMTARLLRGDSRKAYQALDVAIRLYPALTPPRFFALFVEERPLSEAYTVFALACRAGIVPQYGTARQLLTALRTNADPDSPSAHVDALRQMMAVVYMYVGAGGTLTENMLNEIIIALTQKIRVKGVAALKPEQKKRIVNIVLAAIRKTLEIFARYGVVPGISAFNSIIVNLAGYGQAKHIIATALKDAQALGLEPNKITRRSILTAAGLSGDNLYVAEAWNDLVDSCSAQGKMPDGTDYNVLVKAARLSGCEAYAEAALEANTSRLPEHSQQRFLKELRDPSQAWQPFSGGSTLDVSSLLAEVEKLGADLAAIDEHTEHRPTTQDFSIQKLPITMQSVTAKYEMPEKDMRALYDELTTEQASRRAIPSEDPAEISTDSSVSVGDASKTAEEPAVSNTEVPFGTLRYENWKTINYLLALAEQNDEIYNRAVDGAIAAGVAPPAMSKALRSTNQTSGTYRGLSDMNEHSIEGASGPLSADEVQNARREVLRLRGRSLAT